MPKTEFKPVFDFELDLQNHHDQGENPDLSESDAKQIRDQAGARIYDSKYTAKCSRCGHVIPAPPGSCMTCPNCGTSFGACG